jgi:type II secretory ATPase GspE/PulE/Tfp pilus assembly ATPase PilB-like protein
MIEKGVSMRASDIHLDPEEKALALKMRLDGILTDVDKLPKYLEAAVISRIKIMAGMDIAEKRLPQDGRVNVKIAGKDIDLRVASFPTVYGEKMTLRILDKSRGIFKLEELGMSGDYLKIYESVIAKPHGIIFVCGPTGCGKSTTLYSTLSILDKVKNNVMTLEDPVEYLIPRTKQSQINVKAGLTFAVGLRSMLRQDPDIIMIGEVRDRETAEISIHSALTGHLVFSTIHTNDAPSAVARLIDMDIEPFLIASSLSAVLSQRLVRVLCKKCRKKGARVPQEILDRFNISKPEAERICEPIGCKECNSTGYHGRVGVFELLIINDVLREAIIKKSSQHILKKLAIEGGMKPMLLNGIEKVLEGVTSLEEVVRVAETTA